MCVCMHVLECCGGAVSGRWCPRMRGEIAVGFHGGGSCCRTIPDIGGVRWYLSETRRYIGESVIAFIGERCRSGCIACGYRQI